MTKEKEKKIKTSYEYSTHDKWICPKCGEVQSAYFGTCLTCGSNLNVIKGKL